MHDHQDNVGEIIAASKLFDPSWYLQAYPDVGRSGLSAVDHYGRYGFRMGRSPSPHVKGDPSALINALRLPDPNPGRALIQAHQISAGGDEDLGLTFALLHVSEQHRPAIAGLLANQALRRGKEEAWLQSMNQYLNSFDLAPIHLAEEEGLLINRFRTRSLPIDAGGPMVSVLMSAFNAAETVGAAANSILEQTYQNLELLIVDDCSNDSTWQALNKLAARDARVKIFRNLVNVGPYVCRNYILKKAIGDWITCQDADDWSHPQRLERHMTSILTLASPPVASWPCMVRFRLNGMLERWEAVGKNCLDGLAKRSFVGAMFDAEVLRRKVGGWDCVRFGGDAELINRFKAITGQALMEVDQVLMLCLDLESSLTGHSEYGIDPEKGLSPIRKQYHEAYMTWHAQLSKAQSPNWRLSFPPAGGNRRFSAPLQMVVPEMDISHNLSIYSCDQSESINHNRS